MVDGMVTPRIQKNSKSNVEMTYHVLVDRGYLAPDLRPLTSSNDEGMQLQLSRKLGVGLVALTLLTTFHLD